MDAGKGSRWTPPLTLEAYPPMPPPPALMPEVESLVSLTPSREALRGAAACKASSDIAIVRSARGTGPIGARLMRGVARRREAEWCQGLTNSTERP
jgi:hypothetical protein